MKIQNSQGSLLMCVDFTLDTAPKHLHFDIFGENAGVTRSFQASPSE